MTSDESPPRRSRRLTDEQMKEATAFISEWRELVMADREITHASFRTAYALSLHLNWLTFDTFVSQETIANKIHATDRTVREALKQLEMRGYLEKHRRGPNSNLYVLKINDRKKTSGPPENDRKKTSGLTAEMTGSLFPPRPEKNDQKTGRKSPSNDIYNDTPLTTHGAIAAARPSAPAAPSPGARAVERLGVGDDLPSSQVSSPSPAGSLASASARSPAKGDSENGIIPPLAGKEIPRADPALRNGAASLRLCDDGGDPSFEDDWTDPDEERELAKERREEDRDSRLAEERAYRDVESIDDDDVAF